MPEINKKIQKQLIELVKSITKDLSTTDTRHLEAEIDALVYQLYDLTPEEIKIVV